MAGRSSRLSGRRFAAALAALVGVASVAAACTSSGGTPDTSPLSTAASAPPLYCDFVSKQSVQTSLGTDQLSASGSVQHLTGNFFDPDGGRLGQATCTIDAQKDGKHTQPFGAEVIPIRERPDLANQVVDELAAHKPGDGLYVFPRSYGVGWAKPDEAKNPSGATVYLLRGNWFVNVGVDDVAKGRDPIHDVVALTHQIVAFLHLPTTHAKPYPTPSASR
jgi:hypothetical protein